MAEEKRSIDECPAPKCGAWVPGIDAAEVFEGSLYRCTRGHSLVACVSDDGRAYLIQDRRDLEDAASKIGAMGKAAPKKARKARG